MTRMQKWQSYREEIAKQAAISVNVAADEERRIKYKTEIDKINPAILSSALDENVSLEKGVSIVEGEQAHISIDIAEMFSTINKAANIINQDKVESIFYEMRSEKIWDKNNNFIDEKLLKDNNYSWFKQEIKKLDFNKTGNDAIQKQLQDKYNSFSSKKEKYNVEPVLTIDKNSEKQVSHYVFVISISVSLLLLLILVSLFITKAVLR